MSLDDIKSVIIREFRYREPGFINLELIRNLELASTQSDFEQ